MAHGGLLSESPLMPPPALRATILSNLPSWRRVAAPEFISLAPSPAPLATRSSIGTCRRALPVPGMVWAAKAVMCPYPSTSTTTRSLRSTQRRSVGDSPSFPRSIALALGSGIPIAHTYKSLSWDDKWTRKHTSSTILLLYLYLHITIMDQLLAL